MSKLRQRMIDDLKLRNYSPCTVVCYVRHVQWFARHFGKSPDQLGLEHIRQYQLHLIKEKHASWSTFNQAVCALRFFYKVTLSKDWDVKHIPYGKVPRKLPKILSPGEVLRFLPCVRPLKQRLVLTTCYAAGLRLGEALHLRSGDIDSGRMMIHVRHAKRQKERFIPLSPALLDQLRHYWKVMRPETWLFPGRDQGQPLERSSVQRACRPAAGRAGINKRVWPHLLRHCYATHLLEAGVDVVTIQKLLGHKQLSTTLRYAQVTDDRIRQIVSPLDIFLGRADKRPCGTNRASDTTTGHADDLDDAG